MTTKQPTDAEKLAAAEAAMREAEQERAAADAAASAKQAEAQAAANAVRLPFAQAAADFLSGTAVQAVLDQAQALIDASLDDVNRGASPTGEEGTRQKLIRMTQAITLGRDGAVQRVSELTPPPAQDEVA